MFHPALPTCAHVSICPGFQENIKLKSKNIKRKRALFSNATSEFSHFEWRASRDGVLPADNLEFSQNIDLTSSDQNIDLKIDLKTKKCPILEELYFEMLHENFLK